MIVLGVLFGSLIVFRLLGFIGVPVFQTWHESMIFALAVMFCLTAVAHFGPMRRDLERMVPPWVPDGRGAVFVAGGPPINCGGGLLHAAARTHPLACVCLLLSSLLPPTSHAPTHA